MRTLWTRFQQWRQDRLARQITPDAARERVRRGADYLDDVDPGWDARLDPETLELSDGTCCVLGQLHGDFRLGLGRSALFDLSSAPRASLSPVKLGFLCRQDVPEALQARDYAYLNRAWRVELMRRQQGPTRRTMSRASASVLPPGRIASAAGAPRYAEASTM
jgi:hypothetical protein